MKGLKITFWVITLSLAVGALSTFAPDLTAKYQQLKAQEAGRSGYKVDNTLFLNYRPPQIPDNDYVLEVHPGQIVELKNRLISNMSREQEARLTITPKGLLKAEYTRNSAGETIIKPNETLNLRLYADIPAYLKPGEYQASLNIVWHQPGGNILPEMIKPLNFTLRVLPNDLEMNRFNNDRGKWGFIDRFSNVVIPPQFDQVGVFKEGLCPVMLSGRWGYIDTRGNYVVTPKYPEAQSFAGGLAGVRLAADQWGYIDRRDTFIVKPIYLEGTAFIYAGGTEAIIKDRDGQWYYIDKDGKRLRSAPEQTE